MALDPIYKSDAVAICKTLVNADSTSLVDVLDNSAGTKHKRITALSLLSDDTSEVNIAFYRLHGGAAYLIGTVRAATLSGTNGATPRVLCLSETFLGSKDETGIWTVNIHAGDKLQAKSLVAVTSGKTVTITGSADSYE